jgi:dolichyl-phosphate-mannose-protein mannosyltransferase
LDSTSDSNQRLRKHGFRLALLLLIAVSGFATGINWGLPQASNPETVQPWALDTVAPIAPLNEAYFGFTRSGNDFVIYPLFHYAVLSAAYTPYIGFQYLTGNFDDPSSTFPYGLADVVSFCQDLTVIARLVSLLMALGIVLLAYRITLRLVGHNAAFWAAVSTSLIAPLSYYAKTSNLDVPYTFWVCLAVWQYIKIIKQQRHRDYALFGIYTALAVATKDQAYGFFLLTPFALAYARMRFGTTDTQYLPRYLAALFGTPMLLGGAAAVLAYAAANNVFFGGFDGLMRHLAWGGDVYSYRQETAVAFYSLPNQLRLSGQTLLILLQMLGPVTLALASFGLYLAWRERRWKLLSLTLFSISYYLTVIAVFSLVFSRYLLVTAVLLAPFLGLAIDHLRRTCGQMRWVPVVVITLALVPQAALVINLNMTLLADSRQAMGDWIQANIQPGAVIESQVRQRMLPHISSDYDVNVAGNSGDSITMLAVESELTPAALAARNPDYILILEGLGVTGDPAGWDTPSLKGYYNDLISGRLGYQEVARFETPSFIPWRQIPGTRPTTVLYSHSNTSGHGQTP